MKRHIDGTIDRNGWPTREEINKYVDRGAPGSFQGCIHYALVELHAAADELDRLATGHGSTLARRTAALQFYANVGKYRSWGSSHAADDHWVFDGEAWGSHQYHAKPPAGVREAPWSVAQEALR